MMVKVRNKVIFVMFIISAAAVGSSDTILPGVICLVSVYMLYTGCKAEVCEENEPVTAGE